MKAVTDMDCDIPAKEARLSPWAELMWPAEWLLLRMSAVYQGAGIPHGNGEPVIVVPGFLGSDLHTGEMRRWLGRIGYSPHLSGIGRNVDCPDVSLTKLEQTVAAVAESSGRPVRLIGHSLGGMLARAAAVRNPELVTHVITLGSPLRGVLASPLMLWLVQTVGWMTFSSEAAPRLNSGHFHGHGCACVLMESLSSAFPETVQRASVFSRRDGVVNWQSCVDDAPGLNVEVHSSHLGMLANKEVYDATARSLAATRVPARATVVLVTRAA